MVDSFLAYIRARAFLGPEAEKRYYRLFGDLEYDILSLQAELAVMDLRVREVKRRLASAVMISALDERRISATSHELNEHLYARLERLHARIAAAKSFRYDHESERQGYYMLSDIAVAVMGLRDPAVREQRASVVDEAVAAYEKLEIAEMIDLHESVQSLPAMERREALSAEEDNRWREMLAALYARHPLRMAQLLDRPEAIEKHTLRLKQRIDRRQQQLEVRGMVYAAAVGALRFRN